MRKLLIAFFLFVPSLVMAAGGGVKLGTTIHQNDLTLDLAAILLASARSTQYEDARRFLMRDVDPPSWRWDVNWYNRAVLGEPILVRAGHRREDVPEEPTMKSHLSEECLSCKSNN